MALPPFSHEVTSGETPLAVAARYGLPVDALVAANLDGPFDTVLVADAEVLPLADLLATLTANGAFDRPAGALARFLLHGLRLPAPDGIPADGTEPDWSAVRQYPLHTITGQQITPPSPLPAGFAVTLGASPSAPPSLVTFAGGGDSLAVPADEDGGGRDRRSARSWARGRHVVRHRAAVGDALPRSGRRPPAVRPRRPRAVAAAGPRPALSPGAGTAAPAGDVGTSAAVAGTPTLHPFPRRCAPGSARASRRDRSGAAAGPAGRLEGHRELPTDVVPITGFGWATRIDVGVRQTLDPAGQVLPYVTRCSEPTRRRSRTCACSSTTCARAARTTRRRRPAALRRRPGRERLDRPAVGPVRPEDVLLVKANLSTARSRRPRSRTHCSSPTRPGVGPCPPHRRHHGSRARPATSSPWSGRPP